MKSWALFEIAVGLFIVMVSPFAAKELQLANVFVGLVLVVMGVFFFRKSVKNDKTNSTKTDKK